MAYDFMLQIIGRRSYFEMVLFCIMNFTPWFFSVALGCRILNTKTDWTKISFGAILCVLYDFFGKPYVSITLNAFIVIALFAILLIIITGRKHNIFKYIWASILIIVANALGTVLMAPFVMNEGGIKFITKTSMGFLVGTTAETVCVAATLLILNKYKNINLIPTLFDKIDTGITSIITYTSAYCIIYYAGTTFYLKTDFKNILGELVFFLVAVTAMISGHIKIMALLKKRHELDKKQLEERLAELEKLKNGDAWQEYVNKELANTTARLHNLIQMKNSASTDEINYGNEKKKSHCLERIK